MDIYIVSVQFGNLDDGGSYCSCQVLGDSEDSDEQGRFFSGQRVGKMTVVNRDVARQLAEFVPGIVSIDIGTEIRGGKVVSLVTGIIQS